MSSLLVSTCTLATSYASSAQALAGELMEASGAPVASAMINARVWGSSDFDEATQPGYEVPMQDLGATRTAGSGRFTLDVRNTQSLNLADSDGWLDLELLITKSDGSTRSLFVPVQTQRVTDGQLSRSGSERLQIKSANLGTLSLGDDGTQVQGRRASLPDSLSTTAPVDPSGATPTERLDEGERLTAYGWPKGCPISGTKLVRRLGNYPTIVGTTFIQGSGHSSQFRYSSGADSQLGVAVAYGSDAAKFKASGTVMRSRRIGVTFPKYTRPTGRLLKTYFSYGLYCNVTRSPGPSFKYYIKPMRHEGGTKMPPSSVPSAWRCIPYEARTHTDIKRGNAIIWTNGAVIGYRGAGVDISSRTGYRNDAKQEFWFHRKGRLCGQHDYPAGTPRTLVMK